MTTQGRSQRIAGRCTPQVTKTGPSISETSSLPTRSTARLIFVVDECVDVADEWSALEKLALASDHLELLRQLRVVLCELLGLDLDDFDADLFCSREGQAAASNPRRSD
jgi:hypothetical protein